MSKYTCDEFCYDEEAVQFVRNNMLSDQDVSFMADTFKVLSDPTRIKILHALDQRELCVCDIAISLEMKVSAVSHQLRILKGARLIRQKRVGKYVYNRLDDEHVAQLFAKTMEHVRHT